VLIRYSIRKLHKSFLIAYFNNSILYSCISVNMEIAPTVISLWNKNKTCMRFCFRIVALPSVKKGIALIYDLVNKSLISCNWNFCSLALVCTRVITFVTKIVQMEICKYLLEENFDTVL